jgi:hypothetical protein
MAKYRKNFNLDVDDIELIEHALRHQASQVAAPSGGAPEGADAAPCPRRIQRLLGKLHEQKIFYSHTRLSPGPNG